MCNFSENMIKFCNKIDEKITSIKSSLHVVKNIIKHAYILVNKFRHNKNNNVITMDIKEYKNEIY